MQSKLLLTVLVVLTACARPPAGGPAPIAPTLRVMTYNIFAGNDLELRSNLARIAALIDSLDVDVVLLQEVDWRTARSGGVDQVGVLAELTGMHSVFGRAMDFGGGEFGNAILTRWPVRASRVVPLQVSVPIELEGKNYEPRNLLHVVVGTPNGAVHLITTHLDHQAQPVYRHTQLLQLLAYLAETVPRTEPIVIGGDLNAQPDASEVRALTLFFDDAWRICGTGEGHTFRSDRPAKRIDYILLAGLPCNRAWVPDTQVSDHRPVVVEVRLERQLRSEAAPRSAPQ